MHLSAHWSRIPGWIETRIYVTVWCQKWNFMPITRAMDEQLKVLLEGINALKSGQEDKQRSQEEMKNVKKRLRREWRICREAKNKLRMS
ncbi:hypothetical protein TNCV_960541 [Trichonephila clavipes]|nr:hypothetical protein TNCV_960541 [Trichonephila clavipes]